MHFRHRQTDRRTDGLASWHKREMYITSRAKKKLGRCRDSATRECAPEVYKTPHFIHIPCLHDTTIRVASSRHRPILSCVHFHFLLHYMINSLQRCRRTDRRASLLATFLAKNMKRKMYKIALVCPNENNNVKIRNTFKRIFGE